ncbi:PTS system mannose/fructose/N-acetylgalactosamine-transporter subunit IIB [Clostridium butyricum]|uniref:PTS system mannose/fructose/N-acetylgalactosamine-transporter subunit IIB n=1 Tax=Clostridium butyricum TaxID=1492 RepID=UPI0028FD3098|nr:PTS sugar transporter subunit IIB [Clostridium butyricum]MDU0323119.1 PTS sugar transporter subunit IIB [Clostridium butyricum]MDU4853008.1 PTS sugar transporter subunit IIB [Clostridioides difficile]
MEISFVRIDDRLIHGQTVCIWSKEYDCNRIIACSNEAANNPLRKNLLLSVHIPNKKVYVLSIEKALEAYTNPKYNGFKAMFLFTNPKDILTMVNNGVNIKSVNVGGMCYKTGKIQITGAISVSKEDVDAFKQLSEKGVQLEIRQLAKDNKVNLIDKLEELKL